LIVDAAPFGIGKPPLGCRMAADCVRAGDSSPAIGLPEKRVLRHVAPVIAQELQLFFDCHPLSNDLEAEIVGLQNNK